MILVPRPQLYIVRKQMKWYPAGLMNYDRVNRMRLSSSDDREYRMLDRIINYNIMPFRWNLMDIEFGVPSQPKERVQ